MHRNARLTLLLLAAIALAAFLPYARTLDYGFVYDDVPVIAEQASLHTPGGLTRAFTLPYWPANKWAASGLYRPVAQFAYAALWNAGGGRPALFHWYAVLLHVAVSLALFVLLQRALPRWAAALGALLFAVHPVHVEAVANIVGSAEVLAGLASLGFAFVLWRGEREVAPGAPLRWDCAFLAALLYALALGAKETAAALPAMGLLVWWGWRARSTRSEASAPAASDDPVADARGAAPLTLRDALRRGWRVWLLCTVALGLIAVARYRVLGALAPDGSVVAYGIRGLSPLHRVEIMVGTWPTVAELLAWPSRLSMFYGPALVAPRAGEMMRALLVLAVALAIVVLAVRAARRGERRPAAALGWMTLAFLPASNLLVPTGQVLAERTLYVPSIGALMLAAWLLDAGARRMPRAERGVPLLAGLASTLAVAGALGTASGSANWRDNLTLFQSGVAAAPREYAPYFAVGSKILNAGDTTRALPYLERAWSLYPHDPSLALTLAAPLVRAGKQERALAITRSAAAENPGKAVLRTYFLGLLFDVEGPDSVIATLRRTPRPDPLGAPSVLILSRAFSARGLGDSATAALGAGVREYPRDAGLRYLYASSLYSAGRARSAARELDTAAALGGVAPGPVALLRARVLLALGDSARARDAVRLARSAMPENAAASALERSLAMRDNGAGSPRKSPSR